MDVGSRLTVFTDKDPENKNVKLLILNSISKENILLKVLVTRLLKKITNRLAEWHQGEDLEEVTTILHHRPH